MVTHIPFSLTSSNQKPGVSLGVSCSGFSVCMGLWVLASTVLNPASSHGPGGGTDSLVRHGETVKIRTKEIDNDLPISDNRVWQS